MRVRNWRTDAMTAFLDAQWAGKPRAVVWEPWNPPAVAFFAQLTPWPGKN